MQVVQILCLSDAHFRRWVMSILCCFSVFWYILLYFNIAFWLIDARNVTLNLSNALVLETFPVMSIYIKTNLQIDFEWVEPVTTVIHANCVCVKFTKSSPKTVGGGTQPGNTNREPVLLPHISSLRLLCFKEQ